MTASTGGDPPEDDLSVDGETDLYRRVPPQHWKKVGEEFILRDGAFKNFPNPDRKRMSVALGDTLAGLQRDPRSVRKPGQENYGVVAIKATVVRAECQRVERSPRDDEPAHGDVYGEKPTRRRKQFAAHAHWVVYPEQAAAAR